METLNFKTNRGLETQNYEKKNTAENGKRSPDKFDSSEENSSRKKLKRKYESRSSSSFSSSSSVKKEKNKKRRKTRARSKSSENFIIQKENNDIIQKTIQSNNGEDVNEVRGEESSVPQSKQERYSTALANEINTEVVEIRKKIIESIKKKDCDEIRNLMENVPKKIWREVGFLDSNRYGPALIYTIDKEDEGFEDKIIQMFISYKVLLFDTDDEGENKDDEEKDDNEDFND
jgi:hypothetical protein